MSHSDLQSFQPTRRYFIGVDSDGCAFDSMRLKHREAFIPAAINVWRLEPVAEAFTAAEEHVNLRSQHRGINRFAGLLASFERLVQMQPALLAQVQLPDLAVLRAFVDSGLTQSNAGLREFAQRSPSPTADALLAWSIEADARFSRAAKGQPPFRWVAESLARAAPEADVMVVSAASGKGLREDWGEAGLLAHVRVVAGQEHGSKAEQLRQATEGRYGAGRVLLIGDAPGDRAAARAVGALFYPIVPGQEERCWQRFHDEVLHRFLTGAYAGAEESRAIAAFEQNLCVDEHPVRS